MMDREHEEWLGDQAGHGRRAGTARVRGARKKTAPADDAGDRRRAADEQMRAKKLKESRELF